MLGLDLARMGQANLTASQQQRVGGGNLSRLDLIAHQHQINKPI